MLGFTQPAGGQAHLCMAWFLRVLLTALWATSVHPPALLSAWAGLHLWLEEILSPTGGYKDVQSVYDEMTKATVPSYSAFALCQARC